MYAGARARIGWYKLETNKGVLTNHTENPGSAPAPKAQTLSELSAEELAPLLNLSVAEAKRYIENADDLALLMEMPVEDVRRLVGEGRYDQLFMAPRVPADAVLRFRQLQALLGRAFEFEARYPEAYEILFPRRARDTDRAGLHLPSFGIRVLKNDPQARVVARGFRGDDAFSVTHDRRVNQGNSRIERTLEPVHHGDLQGVLLAILAREEYAERIEQSPPMGDPDLFDGVSVPEESPVRITDLRLATALRPGTLKDSLVPILEELEKPVTAQGVIRWKLAFLGGDFDGADASGVAGDPPPRTGDANLRAEGERFFAKDALLQRQFGDDATGTTAVSFAAAALLLFMDLGMPGATEATPYRLSEQIETLAEIVRKLTRDLKGATRKFASLTANRSAGRQPGLAGKDYLALRYYRMGQGSREIAEWLGINPYSSKTGKGTRDWKEKVRLRLIAGKGIEDERYPRAAAVFANRENSRVWRKGRYAYRAYLVARARFGEDVALDVVSRRIRTPSAQNGRGSEITAAYVQLGSCLIQGIPPQP